MGKAKKTGGRRSGMGKYVVKRIVLMFFTFFIISTICFMLVRLLPRELPTDKVQAAAIQERWEALGYNKPLLIQYGIYLKNIFTKWDFGTSWYIQFRQPAWDVLTSRLLPTVLTLTFNSSGNRTWYIFRYQEE